MATTWTPLNGVGTPLSYVPANVTNNGDQFLNVFASARAVQLANAPGSLGAPVLIQTTDTEWSNTTLITSITEGSATNYFGGQLIGMGACFVSVKVSVSKDVGSDYGAPNHGLGLWSPPGHVSGRWEDPTYPMAEKDIFYAVQYIKKNAALLGGVNGLKINPDMIFMNGVSGGGMIWLPLAFGPDRSAGNTGALGTVAEDTQYGFSTRIKGGIFRNIQPELSVNDGSLTGAHMPDTSGTETPAATIADALTGVVAALSISAYEHTMIEENKNMRLMFVVGDTNISHDFVAPYQSVETEAHSAIGGFIAKTKYPNVYLVNQANQDIYSPAPYAAERALTDVFFSDAGEAQNPQAAIVAAWMGLIPPANPYPGAGYKPTTQIFDQAATVYSGTTTGATDEQAVPANPFRKYGVWIWNAMDSNSAANSCYVRPGTVGDGGGGAGNVGSFQLRPNKSTAASIKGVFIPGTAGVVIKRAAAGNITWGAQEI